MLLSQVTIISILYVLIEYGHAFGSEANVETPGIVKDTYIIEFTGSFTKQLKSNQFSAFYRQVASAKANVKSRLNLASRYFNGVSVYLPNSDDLETISNLDSVSGIWPVRVYERPEFRKHEVFDLKVTERSNTYAKRRYQYPPHKMTGVDQLHQMGYYGAGIKVAVIDSGVDYQHPDLGGGFGPGYKISFGYDLVGDAYDGINTPIADSDPFDDCDGHGTHVSGIIGADGPFFRGVVPNATLGMYRVFGCTGGAATDVIIAAAAMAGESGAHVINLSLGSSPGWNDDPLSLILERISSSGTTVIASAGSSGSVGQFYGSSPAGAPGVISVASVDTMGIPGLETEAKYKITRRPTKRFFYTRIRNDFPENDCGYSLVTYDKVVGKHIDACQPLPYNITAVEQKMLLIRYGQCDWATQGKNLRAAGVRHVLFFDVGSFESAVQPFSVYYAIVKRRIANLWITALKNKREVKIRLYPKPPRRVTYEHNTKTGGKISSFSTWYPMNNLLFKPDIAAPGGRIFSTYPRKFGGYLSASGTSMAAPYLSGVVALFLSARGLSQNIRGNDLRNILLTTAFPLQYGFNASTYTYLAPAAQQGLGLVDAMGAVKTSNLFTISTISLNDTDNFQGSINFAMINIGNRTNIYTITHVGAGTFNTFQKGVDGYLTFASLANLSESYATLTFSESNFTLAPGQSTSITVNFSEPVGLDSELLPIYSGYITLTTDAGTMHCIGYLGALGSMKNLSLSDNLNADSSLGYSSTNGTLFLPVNESQTIDFETTTLEVKTKLTMGTQKLRLDVIGTGANITEGGLTIVGSLPDIPDESLGRFVRFPLTVNIWNGTLKSGVLIQPGTYNILVRILKIFGDSQNSEDYYTWTSPTFIVV